MKGPKTIIESNENLYFRYFEKPPLIVLLKYPSILFTHEVGTLCF
jgi:hypothetical protein